MMTKRNEKVAREIVALVAGVLRDAEGSEPEFNREYFAACGRRAKNRHRMTPEQARAAARRRWALAREAAGTVAGGAMLALIGYAWLVAVLSM